MNNIRYFIPNDQLHATMINKLVFPFKSNATNIWTISYSLDYSLVVQHKTISNHEKKLEIRNYFKILIVENESQLIKYTYIINLLYT